MNNYQDHHEILLRKIRSGVNISLSMKKILILEDDRRFNATVSNVLSGRFAVKSAHSLKEASHLIATCHFDCVISDFMLGDGDGFGAMNLLKLLLPKPKIIFMTAFAEKEMLVKLLNCDIDGFLEKPFDLMKLNELLIKTLPPEGNADAPMSLVLIPFERLLKLNDEKFVLTEVEFKIVSYLFTQKDRWIGREELIQYLWGDSVISRNTLDTHLCNLKKKVPKFKDSLKVVRGRGFCFSSTSFERCASPPMPALHSEAL